MTDTPYFFLASPNAAAQEALRELAKRYGQAKGPAECDYIIALGGDGTTLRALQDGIRFKKPVMGFNFGHKGFLQNLYRETGDLPKRIREAETIELSPLKIEATLLNGDVRTAFAVNECYVCHHNQTEGIYLRVSIDGIERVPRLGADGLIIASSIGSTAYSKSARGPILPLGDDIIAFTPNNAFEPDRMRACPIRPEPIAIEVLNPEFRRADVLADTEIVGEACTKVDIVLDKSNTYKLLFDPGYGLRERVMRTQFSMPGM